MHLYATLITLFIISILSGCGLHSQTWETPWLREPAQYQPPPELLEKNNYAPDNKAKAQGYPIDLPTVLRLAGAQPLELAIVREKVHDAYAKVLLSREKFIPNIIPEVEFSRHEEEIQATAGQFFEVDKQFMFPRTKVNLELDVGDAIYSTLAAQQRYHASKAKMEATTRNIVLKAVIAYFELLQSQAEVKIGEEAKKISETLIRQTEAAVSLGKGFKGDVLRAKAQLASDRLALTKTKETLRISSVNLVNILRLDPKINLFPADRIATPIHLIPKDKNIEKLVQNAVEQRPELKEASALLSSSKKEKAASVWGPMIPSVQADIRAGSFGPTLDNLKSTERYNFSLGWKVGSGGLFYKGRRELADAKYRSSEIRLAKLVQDIIQQVLVAHTQVNAKHEQMSIAEQGVKDAEESLKLNEARLRMGIGLPLEVLQAQKALIQARRDYVSSIIGYNKAQYRLFVSIGNKP
ncbi:MAG: TolC family protein [Candidatus Scalinduaceae bacterium]